MDERKIRRGDKAKRVYSVVLGEEEDKKLEILSDRWHLSRSAVVRKLIKEA